MIKRNFDDCLNRFQETVCFLTFNSICQHYKSIDEYKNYTEYENLKNNYKNNSTIIISILEGCIKFNSAIRSILIDYGAIDELKNCVYNNYDESYRQKIYNLIKYFESETFKDNLKNKIEETNKIFEFYYDIIKK